MRINVDPLIPKGVEHKTNDLWQTPLDLVNQIKSAYSDRKMLDLASASDNPTNADIFFYPGQLDSNLPEPLNEDEYFVYCNWPFSDSVYWLNRILFLNRNNPRLPIVGLGPTSCLSNKGTRHLASQCNLVINLGRVRFTDPVTKQVATGSARSDVSLFIWDCQTAVFDDYLVELLSKIATEGRVSLRPIR